MERTSVCQLNQAAASQSVILIATTKTTTKTTNKTNSKPLL